MIKIAYVEFGVNCVLHDRLEAANHKASLTTETNDDLAKFAKATALKLKPAVPDMQNMGNRPPIVALGKEGIGRWKNGKEENETWGKIRIRCHILNILVQHGWPC